MKYFIDTEFMESPCTIELISIGIFAENSRTFYAESNEFDPHKANSWVQKHVFPQLKYDPFNEKIRFGFSMWEDEFSIEMLGNKNEIQQEILRFIGTDKPEFWGYYCIDPKTKILKADLSWANAEDLTIGNNVMGFDENRLSGNGRSKKWRRWRNAIVTGNQKVNRHSYELTFEDGTKVVCAEDHKWLVSSFDGTKWAETRYLKCNSKDGSSSNVVKPLDIYKKDNSFDAGYVSGAFDGEGHLSSEKKQSGYAFRLGFSQKKNKMLSNVIRILDDYNINYGIKKNNSDVTQITISKRNHILKLLSLLRPYRLLPKFNPDLIGAMPVKSTVRLIAKKKVGVRPLIALNTSTKTYIANGLASHNCDYDWVVFCWLFGPMIALPDGWPMYCRDLKQLADSMPEKPRFAEPNGEHNALIDAAWNKDFYYYLKG